MTATPMSRPSPGQQISKLNTLDRLSDARPLHIVVLWNLAVAQPLFDVLGRNAAFFAVRGSGSFDLIAFTLTLGLILPGLLAAAGMAISAVAPRLGRAFHYTTLSTLAAILLLHVGKQLDPGSASWLLGVATVLGVGAAVAYWRWRPLRLILGVLAPVPFLFMSLFLFNTPVRHLVFAGTPEARAATISSAAPVVLIVFDEFPVSSLMDDRREIDAVRFPNFAKLADDATWYRNTTTVHAGSVDAVPALLTGRRTRRGMLPVLGDHPNNIFTLLEEKYRIVSTEALTRLCPVRACGEQRATVSNSVESVASDLSVVFLHGALPTSLAARLPSLSGKWGNFWDKSQPGALAMTRELTGKAVVDSAAHSSQDRAATYREFLGRIDGSRRPTLFFAHMLLPHSPWQYLPSGRQYVHRVEFTVPPGLKNETWENDELLVQQAHGRHLLQVGYVDRLVGELVARLKHVGLYDRALIVLTADHGVSFRPGDSERAATETNAADIGFVPLLIKLPNQQRGRTIDRHVRTIDILPTIADVLDASIPWKVDGRSALAGSTGTWQVVIDGNAFDGRRLLAERTELVARQSYLFGSRVPWTRLYWPGEAASIIGRRLEELSISSAPPETTVEVDNSLLLQTVRENLGVVPSLITGVIGGDGVGERTRIAVSLNGRIAGIGSSYRKDGQLLFSTPVSPDRLRAGRNDVAVYALGPTVESLVLLGSSRAFPSYRIVADAGVEHIAAAGAPTIRIVPGSLRGHLDVATVTAGQARFVGWAASAVLEKPRQRVLVFADERLVLSTSTPFDRPDLGPELSSSGFALALPLAALQRSDGTDRIVRIFGVSDGVASEVKYTFDYRWADEPSFELRSEAGAEVLVSGRRRIRVVPGAVDGYLDIARRERGSLRFAGWSGDRRARVPRERVVLFMNGEFVYSTAALVPRPDLGSRLRNAGFDFFLPRSLLSEHGIRPAIRIFGIVGSRASELPYPKAYEWRADSDGR